MNDVNKLYIFFCSQINALEITSRENLNVHCV